LITLLSTEVYLSLNRGLVMLSVKMLSNRLCPVSKIFLKLN